MTGRINLQKSDRKTELLFDNYGKDGYPALSMRSLRGFALPAFQMRAETRHLWLCGWQAHLVWELLESIADRNFIDKLVSTPQAPSG